MTSSNLQAWFYVELTLKAKADGTSKTVYLSNRPILDDTNKGRYIPILAGISGLGNVAGRYLPEPTRGSIEIDNSPGSYGAQRRFADLMDRYTMVAQTFKLYSAVTDYEDLDVSSNFTLQWQGVVSRYSYEGTKVKIEVASDIIPRRVVTKAITPGYFPNAPTKSLGKHIPVVFGVGVQCEAIQITPDGGGSYEYAYATTLSDKYVVGGIVGYFAKTKEGSFTQVTSAGTVNAIVLGNTAASGKSNGNWLGTVDYTFAKPFSVTADTNYVFVSASLRIYKQLGTDTGGTLECTIRKANYYQDVAPTSAPGEVLATSRIDTSLLASAAGEYDLRFGFPEPLVLSPGDYYICFTKRCSTGGLVRTYADSGASETGYAYENGLWQTTVAAGYEWYWALYGAVFTDSSSTGNPDRDGLDYAYFEATQSADPVSVPDLSKVQYLLSVNGLKDDGSGTITGTPNLTLTGPANAIKVLDKEWNGSTWTGGKLDASEQLDSRTYVNQSGTGHYHRQIGGKTEGQTFLDQIYERICRQHGMRICLFNGAASSLALYAWGTHRSTAAVITDEEAKVEQVTQLGVETVINRILMYYDKRITAYRDKCLS